MDNLQCFENNQVLIIQLSKTVGVFVNVLQCIKSLCKFCSFGPICNWNDKSHSLLLFFETSPYLCYLNSTAQFVLCAYLETFNKNECSVYQLWWEMLFFSCRSLKTTKRPQNLESFGNKVVSIVLLFSRHKQPPIKIATNCRKLVVCMSITWWSCIDTFLYPANYWHSVRHIIVP